MLFGGESVRYFQPISFALLLIMALATKSFLAQRAAPTSAKGEPGKGDQITLESPSPVVRLGQADHVPASL